MAGIYQLKAAQHTKTGLSGYENDWSVNERLGRTSFGLSHSVAMNKHGIHGADTVSSNFGLGGVAPPVVLGGTNPYLDNRAHSTSQYQQYTSKDTTASTVQSSMHSNTTRSSYLATHRNTDYPSTTFVESPMHSNTTRSSYLATHHNADYPSTTLSDETQTCGCLPRWSLSSVRGFFDRHRKDVNEGVVQKDERYSNSY